MYTDLPMEVMPHFNKLTPEKQGMVYQQWSSKKKSGTVALVLAIFGLPFLYFGKIGMWLLYIVTGGGLMIWWVIEIVRANARAKEANLETARNIILGTA